jgi:uncharacterized membrane protein YbhN (UPF0104 family)
MVRKRAAAYTVAACLIALGITIMPIVYFSTSFIGPFTGIMPSIAVLIPFVLPGGALLAFLILTEKDRQKPWAAEQRAREMKQSQFMYSDPVAAIRFGLYSGAIWIFAIALFILLGMLIGFRFSWLVFLFAIGTELLIQARLSNPANHTGNTRNIQNTQNTMEEN